MAVRRIQDLELLTFACRRASKIREEGRAHFSLAVLRDNLGQYQKALESYNNFLRICKECNDGQGQALAYHCIAVNYQLLGGTPAGPGGTATSANTSPLLPSPVQNRNQTPSGQQPVQMQSTAIGGLGVGLGGASGGAGGASENVPAPGVRPELLRKAIVFHNKHRESSDAVGKFVAHLNMGLAYAQLGEKEASTVNHQYALRYALQLHSLEGQSLAIGSLSFSAGMYENDPD
jgi:hypothetical protein